jgi:hypothetical protein
MSKNVYSKQTAEITGRNSEKGQYCLNDLSENIIDSFFLSRRFLDRREVIKKKQKARSKFLIFTSRFLFFS